MLIDIDMDTLINNDCNRTIYQSDKIKISLVNLTQGEEYNSNVEQVIRVVSGIGVAQIKYKILDKKYDLFEGDTIVLEPNTELTITCKEKQPLKFHVISL